MCQWRRHGVHWGGHVHPSFPRGRFSNLLKSVEKTSGGGGVDFLSVYATPEINQRLEHLIKVSIERDIADKIELDNLFELFETSGNRKLAL